MLKLHHKDLVFQPPITTTLSRIHKWKACKTAENYDAMKRSSNDA
ncbi:hypothetical protein HanXRQr2_Chr08g0353631 [Helianthus annuus]|uniref:Uncharacterized protein n=1 Tax=Helianthus annuus TaxID=4232 RepID=A0A9K3NDW3_HELAN|nr:hypothetical protein HanXRQr2_Chr08g0353631 [Helianthus annuus]